MQNTLLIHVYYLAYLHCNTQMLGKTGGATKNGESRDTGKIGYKTNKAKHTTQKSKTTSKTIPQLLAKCKQTREV